MINNQVKQSLCINSIQSRLFCFRFGLTQGYVFTCPSWDKLKVALSSGPGQADPLQASYSDWAGLGGPLALLRSGQAGPGRAKSVPILHIYLYRGTYNKPVRCWALCFVFLFYFGPNNLNNQSFMGPIALKKKVCWALFYFGFNNIKNFYNDWVRRSARPNMPLPQPSPNKVSFQAGWAGPWGPGPLTPIIESIR